MASESTRFTALCVISLASIFYLLSPAHGAFSSQLEGKSHGHSLKGVFRSKRQSVCIDGTYQHEGKTCCLCGAGQFLEKDCSKSPDDRKCQPCESGTYRSTPNYETTCEVCTSCDQLNENKEVAERCTPAKNTKCRCKEDHYCETEICVVCHPCKQCGGEGIKVDCTPTNNTVCGDKTEERNLPLKIGVSVAIIIIIVALIVCGAVLWKMKRTRHHNLNQTPGAPTEEQSLIELQTCHMPDIAQVLGWKDMKEVAFRSSVLDTIIESCVENYPHDVREQTLQLLQIWVEKEGRNASSNLIQILEQSGKRRKAEKVRGILSSGSAAAPNARV